MTTTPEQLLERLDTLGIAYRYYPHPQVFTVDEARRHCAHIPGGHCKNLFLRTRKKHYWLLVLEADARIDLDRLARHVGAGRFSFASRERLSQILGVIPGAVTPLALVNDRDYRCRVVLDQRLMGHETVNFHPLTNDATVAVSPADLLRFIRACGHQPEQLDFSALEVAG